jgi:hypothetical protein
MTVAGLIRQWRTGEIRGLSLRQPHASLVALGEKRIETRSFARKYRGAVAIVSSAALKRTARTRAADDPRFIAAWRRHRGLVDDVDDLPRGIILAVARVVDYVPTETIVAANTDRGPRSRLRVGDFRGGRSEIAFGDYKPNRFGWLFAEPIAYWSLCRAKVRWGSGRSIRDHCGR